MAKIINAKGEIICVSNNQEFITEPCVSVEDGAVLKQKYLLNIFRRLTHPKRGEESEFICEIMYYEKPTEEQIVFELIQNGVSRYEGYATLETVYTIGFEDN